MKVFFLFIIIVSFFACAVDRSPLDVNVEKNIIIKSDKNEYQSVAIAQFTLTNHSERSVFFSRCGTHFIHYLENYEIDHWVENKRRYACRDSLVYYEVLPGQENLFAQISLTTTGKTRLKVFYYDNLESGSKIILYSNEFMVK